MPLLGKHTHTISRAHLQTLTERPITTEIASMEVRPALCTPPFMAGCPLLNARDLGLIPNSAVRQGLAYRCGTLKDDAETKTWLAAHHISVIFDMRHPKEVERAPDPVSDKIQYVRLDTTHNVERLGLDAFAEGDGSLAWKRQYLTVMELYAPTFRAVLEHVRDSGAPFVFHCTAGRDRTGVLAGLLHHIAGTPQDEIVYDYMLSRVGIEPERAMLTEALRIGFGAEDTNTPGFFNLSSLSPLFWNAFEEGVVETYGGWEGYIRRRLGFADQDIVRIRANLLAPGVGASDNAGSGSAAKGAAHVAPGAAGVAPASNIAPGANPNVVPGANPNVVPGANPNVAPGANPNIAPGANPNVAPGAHVVPPGANVNPNVHANVQQ